MIKTESDPKHVKVKHQKVSVLSSSMIQLLQITILSRHIYSYDLCKIVTFITQIQHHHTLLTVVKFIVKYFVNEKLHN
jgi:hypothetical protein